MTESEAINSVLDILKKDCVNPSEEIVRSGEVLIKIGEALRGKTPAEARAIISAVANLTSVMPPIDKK